MEKEEKKPEGEEAEWRRRARYATAKAVIIDKRLKTKVNEFKNSMFKADEVSHWLFYLNERITGPSDEAHYKRIDELEKHMELAREILNDISNELNENAAHYIGVELE